jgi:hypothetical protein
MTSSRPCGGCGPPSAPSRLSRPSVTTSATTCAPATSASKRACDAWCGCWRPRWLIGNPTGGCASVGRPLEADGRWPSGAMYPPEGLRPLFWCWVPNCSAGRAGNLPSSGDLQEPAHKGRVVTGPSRGQPYREGAAQRRGYPFPVSACRPRSCGWLLAFPRARESPAPASQQGVAIVRRGNAARVVGAFP